MHSALVFLLLAVALSPALVAGQLRVGASTSPAAVTDASIQMLTTLANDMVSRWEVLDNNCDPRSVFALTYLYMTANALTLVENLYFDDGNKMATFIHDFAGRYIAAIDAWDAGNLANVSGPWYQAFTFAASGYSNVTQDLILGMNAHINYDLPIITYNLGYTLPQWQADYYRVDDLMNNIGDDIVSGIGERYDPTFLSTGIFANLYFNASIQATIQWRTSADVEAELYQTTQVPALVATLQAANEVTVTALAVVLSDPWFESTASGRIAYCEAHHFPWGGSPPTSSPATASPTSAATANPTHTPGIDVSIEITL